MAEITITIDGQEVRTESGKTVLRAAQDAGIYIPFLCDHPDLTPVGQCNMCVVSIVGTADYPLACKTEVAQGMVVTTDSAELQVRRREALGKILSEHPHACLECWRRERCSPFDVCLRTVAVDQHCLICPKNGFCEFQRLVDYVGIEPDLAYNPKGYTVLRDNPFYERNYELCVLCGRCVRVCRDVRGIGVYAFDNEENPTRVDTVKGGSVGDSGCKFCFACVEVCPTGAIVDKMPLTKIVKNREGYIVPCSDACPAHIDIPRYVNYVKEGKYGEALAVVREKVPFPGSLGRVCIHPCEQACRRDALSDSIGIKDLKRVAADMGDDQWKKGSRKSASTGKKVAVVGAGPAGLTAGFYLAKAGHKVVVYEALPEAGGMMRVGIPEYRLPRDILGGEIDIIRDAGVEIRTNTRVESVDSLLKEGYDAVFVGIGAHEGMKIGVDGEELPGVMDGATFLREANLGRKVDIKGKVAIIGGGNAAMDAARVSLRVGAKEVVMVYRRTRAEMPADPEEIIDSLDEGVQMVFLAAPSKITQSNGKLSLECIKMELGEPDASGRRRPVPIKGSEYATEFDNIIAAIGQAPLISDEFGIKIGRGNTIQVNKKTMETSKPGVFAAGDAVTGAASVIEAIAGARQAASAIDKYLGGDGIIKEVLAPVEEASLNLDKDDGPPFADRKRIETHLIPLEERLKGFTEAKPCLSGDQAHDEAGRCLRCDLRLKITRPPLAPVVKKVEPPLEVAEA
ncbi:MAG: FAD-dependent oxidoreductase [Chloroflexota bacterium]|nr:FAD-dependent oxidoreductase [Chloroflexota bacterium]